MLVVSLRWKYQYIKKQQLNLKKTYCKLKQHIWVSFGLLACECMMWEVGGIVIGGVSEVAVSVEIKITIKFKKNLPAVKMMHLGIVWGYWHANV